METPTVIAILSFLGGGTILAIVNWLINRRKQAVEIGGLKDDQTVKWRDNALHLSDQLLDKDVEIQEATMKLHDCLKARRNCPVCETD